jgi:hypothetical protein
LDTDGDWLGTGEEVEVEKVGEASRAGMDDV